MGNMGKYIYGIINSDTEQFFGFYEINENFRVGIYAIPYQDISAVVSDSEIIDYTHMFKDVLAQELIKHQKAIEKIMPEYEIIPVRLGTIVSDENEVREILHKGYKIIKDVFEKITDKIEIDLTASWSNFGLILKEAGEEKEIREFKESLSGNPNGVTVDDQMKVGFMVKKALDKRRDGYAKEIENTLKAISQDYQAHQVMDDKMIINSAFLIDKTRREDFEGEVEELNIKFNEILNFRCIGPLPPYSFCALEINKMSFKEVDWAKRRFGLNDIATKEEIEKAHRLKALFSHPDKNPNVPGIEKEFNEVTRAYKILNDYCQGRSCSFKEEDFKRNSLIVRIRE